MRSSNPGAEFFTKNRVFLAKWAKNSPRPTCYCIADSLSHTMCVETAELLQFFLNGERLSLNLVNSGNLINHWSMNKVHLKDPLCYLCLPGAGLALWFVTQEVEDSNTAFFAKIVFKFYRFCTFYRVHLGKTLIVHSTNTSWIGVPQSIVCTAVIQSMKVIHVV